MPPELGSEMMGMNSTPLDVIRGPGLMPGVGFGREMGSTMGIPSGSSGKQRGAGLGMGDGWGLTGMTSGSGSEGPPPGDCAITLIDKLGMRANAITKSFFMFVFMIVLILRLTPKIRK